MSTVLMVIAPTMFRDEEYAHPREVLLGRGARVITASVHPGECVGKLGMHVTADIGLRDAHAEKYDAVLFIGGSGASLFFDDPIAHALARTVHQTGAVLGAICIAPSILARAGLLKGRAATSFPSQEEDLRSNGAIYSNAPVQSDGRIITANGPDAAYAFGQAVADALDLPCAPA